MKAKQIKVSVIIPTYNRANLLPRAIKSVLRQTMPYFELLIINKKDIHFCLSQMETVMG
ncbi:MAG: glycosyltransferase family A protein [Pseudomonadota bacterium]